MTLPLHSVALVALVAPVALAACGAPSHSATVGADCPQAPPPVQRAPDGTPLPVDIATELVTRMDAIADAQRAGDGARVGAAVCAARETLGVWQGVGEAATEYRAVTGMPDAGALRGPYLAALDTEFADRETWVVVGGVTSGTALSGPLREPCNIVRWYIAAMPLAEPAQRDRLERSARAGLDWLVSLQRPEGHFPYPDFSDDLERYLVECTGTEEECMRAAPRHLQLHAAGIRAWEQAGRPAGVYVDGWLVDDSLSDPGGLQFDTGVCARALLDGHAAFGEDRYLAAARRAGAYARAQVAVPNWNYNAFSVELLATLGDTDAALAKARLGVLPGALPDGRWFDPHNTRIVYHHILLRALLVLADDTDDPEVHATVAAAVDRSVRELEAAGAAGIEEGIEALVHARARGLSVGRALDVLVQGASQGGIRSGSLAYWLRAEP